MNQKTEEVKEALETTVNEMPGTPSVPAGEETAGSEQNEEGIWDEISRQIEEGEDELDEFTGEAPAETPPAEETPAAETQEAQPAVAPEQQESQPEAAEEPAGQEATQETTEQPQAQEPMTPEMTDEKFQELRTQAMVNVAKQFELSEEDADLFLTEPQQAIPKMAARLFMDVYESVMRGVHMAMPAMVQNVGDTVSAAQRAETDFYESWPQLQDDKYRDTVVRLGAAYRQANPNADVSTFIQDVGAQAVVALKLPIPGAETVELPTDVTETPPAQQTPPTPTQPSGGGQAPTGAKNPWEEMSIEFEQEDDF